MPPGEKLGWRGKKLIGGWIARRKRIGNLVS